MAPVSMGDRVRRLFAFPHLRRLSFHGSLLRVVMETGEENEGEARGGRSIGSRSVAVNVVVMW